LASTGGEAWFLFHHSPMQAFWLNFFVLISIGFVNRLIVSKRVEICRSIDIRPGCMIVGDADIFWLRDMETGWPSRRPARKSASLRNLWHPFRRAI
jgi:hypothetical protein